MTFIERIVDVTTGETTEREYTKAEAAKMEKRVLESQAELDALAAKAAEKSALLAKLGITDDEAKLLLS